MNNIKEKKTSEKLHIFVIFFAMTGSRTDLPNMLLTRLG